MSQTESASSPSLIEYNATFLFLLLLFRNPADRKEKRKIDKEHRIGRKKRKKKRMPNGCLSKFQQNFVKYIILTKKLEKTKKQLTKTKPNCTSQKVIITA